MTAPTPEGIELSFRPKSYFWPLGLETHLLSRIKGAERKAALRRLIDAGHLDDIPAFLAESALTADERQMLGRLHPAFMGGEYLHDLLRNEVMVARITIASTTQDITCVYARRGKNRIYYRVVDEYRGDTLSKPSNRSSTLPLNLGQLEAFFTGAWSIYEILEMNFADDGYDLDEMLAFVSFDSQFYPQFGQLYRERIAAWAATKRVDDDEDLTDEGSAAENVFDHYTNGEPIGMDHPLFMVRMQARIDAGWAAADGVPLAEALRSIRARMQDLFGDVPLALVDSTVTEVFAQHAAAGSTTNPEAQ